MKKLLFLCLTLSSLWSCHDQDDGGVILNPNAGIDLLDIENDGYKVKLNAAEVSEGLIGTWRIYIGENGVFEDIHDPKTIFHGEPGVSYHLGWEVSKGKDYDAATITVSFKEMAPKILTDIGDTTYNNRSVYLEAEAPKFGATGHWEIVSGENGRIENADHFKAEFIGQSDKKYKVRWTLTYGGQEAFRELDFRTDSLRADAGSDNLDVQTSKSTEIKFYTLEGFLPAGATGAWKIIDGNNGRLHDLDNQNSLFEGVADSLYQLQWTVKLDNEVSKDTVHVRFRGKWGFWKDERDEQVYRFTEVNGLDWMADNFNYAQNPGNGSWYYGHAERSVIKEGHALETESERKYYGRLYDYASAVEAAPEGWRLPTSAEFYDLVSYAGGRLHAKEKITEGGETGIDFNLPGYLEFSSGQDPAFRNVFNEQDSTALYWTANYAYNGNAETIYFSNGEDYGTTVVTGPYYALPVRYVREVQ
ncbi:FISUMP domain-containing protein [Reichenbachiella ulvae]|uniref:Fibrobacter succinogenes major paralogous domain-containing protein n=1 Tax=Reichenbachiella ulvae TaxID=2980104 RepID=A0ABT3CNK6_9BACT|nr:FISUMP domain-containing protein [Reichenbachiella ulvae]MCV9385227.1 hypothetical protein [Reichenbachiella ulvae]